MKKVLLPVLVLFLYLSSYSENYVRNIYIENGNVFPDTANTFMSGLFNALHIPTRKYIIRQELLFEENDIIYPDIMLESERNLRRMNIFTDVDISLDTVGYDLVDVYVRTMDKWSTTPALLIGSGGGENQLGFKMEDDNVAGRAYFLSLQALRRTENDIGWQGSVFMNKPRFMTWNLDLGFDLISHQYKTQQYYDLSKPYRNLQDTYSWQVQTTNIFGQEFIYKQDQQDDQEQILTNIHERKFSAYYSMAWIRDLRSFATFYFDVNSTERGSPIYRRAFDNSGKFLIQFSSVSEDYFKTNRLNMYQDEDIMVGGYGSVILGRTFAVDSTGDRVWYAGARGERSWVGRNWYIYTQVAGGSGFDEGFAKYTFQDSKILSFLTLGSEQLLALRFRQETAWNWADADRQLLLDNDNGLRGFDLNRFAGDSRIQANLEYRWFPGWKSWVFKISWAAFYDMGTTWDRDFGFENARWYKSAGLGIRFHNEMATGETNVYRIDFAYNFDDMKFGGIIFTTGQSFSAFDIHNFRIPDIFGLDFDGE